MAIINCLDFLHWLLTELSTSQHWSHLRFIFCTSNNHHSLNWLINIRVLKFNTTHNKEERRVNSRLSNKYNNGHDFVSVPSYITVLGGFPLPPTVEVTFTTDLSPRVSISFKVRNLFILWSLHVLSCYLCSPLKSAGSKRQPIDSHSLMVWLELEP